MKKLAGRPADVLPRWGASGEEYLAPLTLTQRGVERIAA